MSMQLTGYIKSFGNAGFIAGVNELKGMVEQANSPQGAIDKLVTALKIRTSFVKKVSVDSVTVTVEPRESTESNAENVPQKELNLVLQS